MQKLLATYGFGKSRSTGEKHWDSERWVCYRDQDLMFPSTPGFSSSNTSSILEQNPAMALPSPFTFLLPWASEQPLQKHVQGPCKAKLPCAGPHYRMAFNYFLRSPGAEVCGDIPPLHLTLPAERIQLLEWLAWTALLSSASARALRHTALVSLYPNSSSIA